VRREAERRGVAGWATNRADGAVESVFEGTPEAVQAMVEFVRAGPGHAEVSEVDVHEQAPEGLSGFFRPLGALAWVGHGGRHPLRPPRVQVLLGRVIVENVVVDDPAAAAFVARRIDAGEDPARVVADAVEVGARVLEREQAAVDAEFVRGELERVSGEVERAFTDKARVVAEFFGTKVDEVFGPEDGHLAKELQRLFGEGSTAAVQHQLRQVMLEQSARMREDLLKQFSSADGSNHRWPTSRPPTCA